MTILKSVISGAVQGLTEFLPISSSGHLVLLHSFFGIQQPQILFDLFLHLGTLTAVVIYFNRDIVEIITKKRRILGLIILGSVPLAFLGLLIIFCRPLKEGIERLFISPLLVGVMLLITGLWLCLPAIVRNTSKYDSSHTLPDSSPDIPSGSSSPLQTQLSLWQAFAVGLAQAVAVLPGISRSGATISTGLICGLDRDQAARFSFLLSIPAILAGVVFKLKDIIIQANPSYLWLVIPGFLTAGVVGFICIHFLLKVVRSGRLYFFGFYCLVIGLVVISRTILRTFFN